MSDKNVLSFCIKGNPISMTTQYESEPHFWNSLRQRRFNFKQEILRQYEEQTNKLEPPPLEGPIKLILQFFLAPKPLHNIKTLNHQPHQDKPKLSDLERFVEHTLSHLVFTKRTKIAQITASKTYDHEPRTLITITTL